MTDPLRLRNYSAPQGAHYDVLKDLELHTEVRPDEPYYKDAHDNHNIDDLLALVDVPFHRGVERHQSLPNCFDFENNNYGRLHQALTTPQPRSKYADILEEATYLTSQLPDKRPVVPFQTPMEEQSKITCSKCKGELSPGCLVQSCIPEEGNKETQCRDCGQELTVKCILAMCKSNAVQLAH